MFIIADQERIINGGGDLYIPLKSCEECSEQSNNQVDTVVEPISENNNLLIDPIKWLAKQAASISITGYAYTKYYSHLYLTKLKYYYYGDPDTIEPTFSTNKHVYLNVEVPFSLQLDYLESMVSAQLKPGIMAYERYVDYLLYGQPEPIIPPSPAELIHYIYHSQLSWYVTPETKDNSSKWRILDMSRLQTIDYFPEYYLDIYKAKINYESQEIIFYSKLGDEYRSTDGQLYNLATLNFLSSIMAHSLTIDHSYMHVHLPDVVATWVYDHRFEESILHKLLTPHSRFSMAVANDLWLNPSSPIYNTNDFAGKYLNAFKFQPLTGENFVFANANRAVEFYQEDPERELKFTTPPTLNEEFPYQQILKKYYDKVHDFVTKLEPHLQADLPGFINYLGKYISYISENSDQYKPIEILTTYIWQTVFVHGFSHCASLILGMQNNVKYYAINKPLRDCTSNTTLEEIVDPAYTFRYDNFHYIFTYFQQHPNLAANSTMDKLNYNFGIPELDQFTIDFVKELEAVAIEVGGDMLCPMNVLTHGLQY